MAGEYYKWLARNEKPEEKRELTREEKIRNWWHYYKWYVIAGLAALWLLGGMVTDAVAARRSKPDYTVAYVGGYMLPEDTVTALETALASLAADSNGDGRVTVQVNQYMLYEPDKQGNAAENQKMSYSHAGQVQLMGDIEEGTSTIFLLAFPDRFTGNFQILSYLDGTAPEEPPVSTAHKWLAWADCPVLTALELGSYTDGELTGDNQEILSKLYVARRAYWTQEETLAAQQDIALWEQLIAGAEIAEQIK